VIMLAHLSETQRRALVIADNKIAENAGWDEEMLRLELQALNDADFDLDITGFDFEDLERLLNGDVQENQGLTDDDTAPEIQEKPISQPGDLWLLGDHRVLCGPVGVADKIYLACNARRHGAGGSGKGYGRRSRRHGLYRSALQC